MSSLQQAPKSDQSPSSATLGDWSPPMSGDLPVEQMIKSICARRQKPTCSLFHDIYQELYSQIDHLLEPAFCLRSVNEFLISMNKTFPFNGRWSLRFFEIWLNGQKTIGIDQQLQIRAKIAGRYIPRSTYQIYFPLGKGQTLAGHHQVTAHSAPDLDTCVASLWGWLDAFAARLADHSHTWNLPGGYLAPQDRLIIDQLFGEQLLLQLPTKKGLLDVTALDLVSPPSMIVLKSGERLPLCQNDPISLIVLIGENGEYLEHLCIKDLNRLLQIYNPLENCLQWLFNRLQEELRDISLRIEDIKLLRFLKGSFEELPPVASLNDTDKKSLLEILQLFFELPTRLETPLVRAILKNKARCAKELTPFFLAANLFDQLSKQSFLDLNHLKTLMKHLANLCQRAKSDLLTIDVLIWLKNEIFEVSSKPLMPEMALDEVKEHVQEQNALPVVLQDGDGLLIPLGAISGEQLKAHPLGTATLRDFCNKEEISIPDCIEIVSVIDHHKSELQTNAVATCTSADVQSCNVLIAEMTLALNDRFSVSPKGVDLTKAQLMTLVSNFDDLKKVSNLRQLQRLINRCFAEKTKWYVHPEREMIEYLSLLHAIFDDTDLLMKVTPRDVNCVVRLLNRAKSLQLGKDIEMIEERISDDQNEAREMVKCILQHPETYSLYSKVFAFRAESIEFAMKEAADCRSNSWFSDTKEQNNLARIGQSKLFTRNFETFALLTPRLRARFIALSKSAQLSKDLCFHLHLCSTIADADEARRTGPPALLNHFDQLWFWASLTEKNSEILKEFLESFTKADELKEQSPHFDVYNDRSGQLTAILTEKFTKSQIEQRLETAFDEILIVMHVKASSFNSRKAAISPHIPKQKYS